MLNKNGKSALEKVNKMFESNFYNRYVQYEGRNLTLPQMKNVTKLCEKYPDFKDEVLSDDFLKLDLRKTADNFFDKHSEYKGKLLMGDIFIAEDFFNRYPNLQNKKQIWAIEDIEKIINEWREVPGGGSQELRNNKIKEINDFYGKYPEYIGLYLNKSERDKIEKFMDRYPNLSGQRWSFKAMDEFNKIDTTYIPYVNTFYKKYPEYKGDYLEKGRIVTLEEMYKISDFLEQNPSQKGRKWDIKAIYALDALPKKERTARLSFYKNNPETRIRYVNEELFNYEKEQIEYANKLRNSLSETVKRFMSGIKLKSVWGEKFTRKINKEVELNEDNLTYKGIAIKTLERYPTYIGRSLNKKQMKALADYYKDSLNEDTFFSLKAIDRLGKGKYNESKGYVTYNKGYSDGHSITEPLDVPEYGESFYKENPEYKGYPLSVKELESAIVFSKRFSELKGVVWEPHEMEEVLKLPKQEQIRIKEFYRDNPDYKQRGVLLSSKEIQQINEIYATYPQQKGKVLNEQEIKSLYRKRRWVNLENKFNEIKNHLKEMQHQPKMLGKFYEDYPQYRGVNLTKEMVQKLNEFFDKYPLYKGDNLTLDDVNKLDNFFEKNKEYKASKLSVDDIRIANNFLVNYPKLKNGKRWDIESMEKFIYEKIGDKEKVARDRAINVFYDKNPEYKGIYLDKTKRDMISKFFREYPALKSDKAWKLETIEKFNNQIPKDKKEFVNDFYVKNPSYKGQYLEIDDMNKVEKFFENHPEIERSNWEVKAIDSFEKSQDKERILAIYKARPDLNGVYLMEAEKQLIERNMPPEKKKHSMKLRFGGDKSKKNTKDNSKGISM